MEKIKFNLQQIKDIRQVYQLHLQNNHLDNDSDSLTITEMYDYCLNHIDDEDLEWYGFPIELRKQEVS